jgi:hypothetical protein
LDDVKRYDATRQIIIVWDIDDVRSVREDLSNEQCQEVLDYAKRNHDAGEGINWSSLEDFAESLFPMDD